MSDVMTLLLIAVMGVSAVICLVTLIVVILSLAEYIRTGMKGRKDGEKDGNDKG